MNTQVAVREGLFTWPAARPQLLGSCCPQCGEHAFPAQRDCRNCGCDSCTTVALGDRGTLWTWTIQSFMPKPPYRSMETEASFSPYGVGYVEMPCGLRVEARLRENRPEQLAIGMPMQLAIVPFRVDESGNEIMVFTFQRAQAEGQ